MYVSWDASAGATSYDLQRSLDGVNFTSISAPTLNNYLDTAVTVATAYWYKVAAINGSGTGIYTKAASVVPTPTGEMSLGEIRQRSKERADRVGSEFISTSEWDFFINQAMFELYDLLVTTYQDLYVATPATILTDGQTSSYALPDGALTFINGDTQAAGYIAPPFFKLIGVDLGMNGNQNAYTSVRNFNFSDRNRYVYPNTASTIYGVNGLQYRMVGDKLSLIPTPAANQRIRLWYVPRLKTLLKDTDVSTIGVSGWLQYVLVRAAKYALDKEESDTSKLDQELSFLKTRIEQSAPNRDAGMPDRISDTRRDDSGNGWGNGQQGGW